METFETLLLREFGVGVASLVVIFWGVLFVWICCAKTNKKAQKKEKILNYIVTTFLTLGMLFIFVNISIKVVKLKTDIDGNNIIYTGEFEIRNSGQHMYCYLYDDSGNCLEFQCVSIRKNKVDENSEYVIYTKNSSYALVYTDYE